MIDCDVIHLRCVFDGLSLDGIRIHVVHANVLVCIQMRSLVVLQATICEAIEFSVVGVFGSSC